MKYQIGTRVEIIKGTYKANKCGIFNGTCGTTMCYVKVDFVGERRIRLSSIAPMYHDECDGNNTTEETLEELLQGLANIRLVADEMERKIIMLKENVEQDRMVDELTGARKAKSKRK